MFTLANTYNRILNALYKQLYLEIEECEILSISDTIYMLDNHLNSLPKWQQKLIRGDSKIQRDYPY